MSAADVSPEQRTAVRTAQAALLRSPHPCSNIVEQVVTALAAAGLLMSPRVASEERATARAEAADWLEYRGETRAAKLLRTCDPATADDPIPYVLADVEAPRDGGAS